jgi:hypothetical protein
MIRLEGVDGWWDRLVDWRASIAGQEKIPRKVVVGRNLTCEFPYLREGLKVCLAGMYLEHDSIFIYAILQLGASALSRTA